MPTAKGRVCLTGGHGIQLDEERDKMKWIDIVILRAQKY
jgi:hypothetical protein